VDDAAMIFLITGHKLLEIQAESAHIHTAHCRGVVEGRGRGKRP